jgi:hypothetical protein
MDFSAKLEKLQQHATDTVASARAAADESHEQLRQRIDQAQVEVNLALKDTQQDADAAAEKAQSKWARMRADAAAKMDDVKAKIDKRADQLDAKMASSDADTAEADASAAIDFADWAVDNARLAVLDALDARAYADERDKLANA